jgi:phosphatidylglycerol---prolipoprotein diacylglyceryl transferase
VGPFPTEVQLGPLHFYLYGLGLGCAGTVGYYYAKRRLQNSNLPTDQFWIFATGLIIAGLVGARIAHLVTNWSLYQHHPSQWLALWNGGLASFGGIALALPIGLVLKHRIWPKSSFAVFLDRLVPALLLGWAIGRVLGPQFMFAGGGHQTHQWFGMYYQGQIGKRVPVPLIQGLEDAALWWGAITLEQRSKRPGLASGVAIALWGLVRALDEYLLLGQHSHSGSLGVQISGVVLAILGTTLAVRSVRS